ncbi:MAG: NAD(P)-binding protein [Actinomycetota bacterium]|nr:NAD(P)-binding protein [Actinomycetota bacterium]
MSSRVAVVGAGMSAAACARSLRSSGITVDVLERAHAAGGRMAAPSLHGRRVDVGAAYLTAKEPDFVAVIDEWIARGLVREWTDTFEVFAADGHRHTAGPMRYSTSAGLASLVLDALPVDVSYGTVVESLGALDHDAVVLAMPDPQAARLVGDGVDWVEYEPVLAVSAGWPERCWPIADAAFVNDDADLTLVVDDGSRRGDGAAVLVAHTTSERARAHLDAPDEAVPPTLAALRRVLGVTTQPQWTHVHRWTFAKPAGTHGAAEFGLLTHTGRPLGLCGDSWCPSGAPRVESAWLSGHRLGLALAEQLQTG